ncbi:MAG: response regulator [Candidatus Omnitrophica bacterium]|nr:response regulator [Candidatus Omnitrophota bacterium]
MAKKTEKKPKVRKNKEVILVIDDEEVIRDTLGRILQRRGFSVISAKDGEEGLYQIMNNKVQIVFCDIMMPKINGLEFLRCVHEYNSSVEVVMITGYSTLDNCIESVEKGACGYLTKPFQISEIFESINKARRNIREKKEIIRRTLDSSKGK